MFKGGKHALLEQFPTIKEQVIYQIKTDFSYNFNSIT